MEKTYIDGVSDLEYAVKALKTIYKNYTKTAELNTEEAMGALAIAYLGTRRVLASLDKSKEDLENSELLKELPREVVSRCKGK